jgi:SAM-dependent methyltransferase
LNDRDVERRRYDETADARRGQPGADHRPLGAMDVPELYREPYTFYERVIEESVQRTDRVLEIGSGSGLHSAVLARSAASVVATDVAEKALSLLARRFENDAGLYVCAADMEALPFREGSFDVVASAGSLSYGEPACVDAEISRVLRKGGSFVCVDSLNHNPAYRLNRWIHYVRGRRTLSTLRRMPDLSRIAGIGARFESMEVRYFGGFLWALPAVVRIVGVERAVRLSRSLDRLLHVRRSAFKFVLVARGRL